MKPRISSHSWMRLVESARPSEDESSRRSSELPLPLGGLVAAAAGDEPIQIIWSRRESPRRVRILWGTTSDALPVRGVTAGIDQKRLQQRVDDLRWVSFSPAIHDVVGKGMPSTDITLEDLVLSGRIPGATWLVQAEPVDLHTQAEWTNWSQTSMSMGQGSTDEQIVADRIRRVMSHLDAESSRGIWRTTIWCGGETTKAAKALAAQLTATSDAVRTGLVFRRAAQASLISSTALTAFAREPERDLPGLPLRRLPQWDVAPEVTGPIKLGSVLTAEGKTVGQYSLDTASLNRHTFVCGATGSGKSETVRRLLEGATAQQVPWLVVEPAKAEYHNMAALVSPTPVSVMRVGMDDVPLCLNPLEPSVYVDADGNTHRFPLSSHISLVAELFNAAFEPDEPFPQVLMAGLNRSYTQAGWSLVTGEPISGSTSATIRYPTLGQLRECALDVVGGLGYGQEVADNVRGFVDVRISSLRHGTAGRFFESGHPFDLQQLLTTNCVVQIEEIGNEREQAFFMGALLIRWMELLRLVGPAAGKLRHLTVLEEAHRLLKASDGGGSDSVEQFANLLAEIRAYGEGVVVAEQIPTKIISDVIKNSAVKVMHRLPALEDRDFVGATMNLDSDQSEAVVALRPGEAVVHTAGMDRPLYVAMAERQAKGQTVVLAPLKAVPHDNACAPYFCTVEELDVSRQLSELPEFQGWVDLVAVALAVGREVPIPATYHLERWRRLVRSRRRLACAVSSAARASVASRVLDILLDLDPDVYGDALGTIVRSVIMEDMIPARDPKLQLGEYRWSDLEIELVNLAPDDLVPPALKSAAGSRNLVFDEMTCAEAIRHLRYRHAVGRRSYWDLLYGRPSILKASLRALGMPDAGSFVHWLELTDGDWIASILDDTTPPEEGDHDR